LFPHDINDDILNEQQHNSGKNGIKNICLFYIIILRFLYFIVSNSFIIHKKTIAKILKINFLYYQLLFLLQMVFHQLFQHLILNF